MTPQQKRDIAARARNGMGIDWWPSSAQFNTVLPQIEDAEFVAGHDPTLVTLLWDVVHAAEHGPERAIADALNAVYRRIGYEP